MTKSFQVYVRETGYDLGVYDGETEREALDVLDRQAGTTGADRAELEVVEMTASAWASKRADMALRCLSDRDDVYAEQDWDAETTTLVFADGTRLVVDGPTVTALD